MSDPTVAEIELNMKEAQEFIDLHNAVERLRNNRDFEKVIMNGYLRDEAIRLVHLKADPSMQNENIQTNLLREIDSIGCLIGYFQKIRYQAEMAREAIREGEEALEEIRNEGEIH